MVSCDSTKMDWGHQESREKRWGSFISTDEVWWVEEWHHMPALVQGHIPFSPMSCLAFWLSWKNKSWHDTYRQRHLSFYITLITEALWPWAVPLTASTTDSSKIWGNRSFLHLLDLGCSFHWSANLPPSAVFPSPTITTQDQQILHFLPSAGSAANPLPHCLPHFL